MKLKILVGIGIVVVLLLGGYYAWGKWQDYRVVDKKLMEAQANVLKLKSQQKEKETAWVRKETEFKSRIVALNSTLDGLKRRNDVLEGRIKERDLELARVTVPDKPDDICPEFFKLGYKSCTRIRKNR